MTTLYCRHMSPALIDSLGAEAENTLLGAITFGKGSAADNFSSIAVPCLQLPMQMLVDKQAVDEAAAHCEGWFSEKPAVCTSGKQGDIVYRHNGDCLFGVITLSEADLLEAGLSLHSLPDEWPVTDNESQPRTPLQAISERAYRDIFSLLDTLQYSELYRCWNYMADINAVTHGQERYRQFNIGRQDAMVAFRRQVSTQLPAACALGIVGDDAVMPALAIAFLAGRQPALAIENPRQVSAYDYPERYGPRSPSFSRAALLHGDSVKNASRNVLFISGTASIVGHQTLHAGDVVAQTRETLENISALVKQAKQAINNQAFNKQAFNKQVKNADTRHFETKPGDIQCDAPTAVLSMDHALYRVYLRYDSDRLLVRNELERILGPQVQAVFINADICRSDLLVEIEVTLFS